MQDDWGRRTPRTQIVAIGAAGSIDARLLEETFAPCIPAAATDLVGYQGPSTGG
jgi:hypothetical protein